MNTLPAPRLQLRWASAEPNEHNYQWQCHYELILPLREGDIRRGEEEQELKELVVALKEPTVRGSNSIPCRTRDGEYYYDAPYRDGVHAKWDAEVLGNLPIYVISLDGRALTP